MRELECELSFLNKCDGSAAFQHGFTRALCAVYGPTEVKLNQEKVDRSTLDCIIKPKIGLAGVKEKSLENLIAKTCEEVALTTLHPRSAMQIVIQILQDSGSLLSCLLNSACMAMVHAGIPMKSMMVAVSCCISKNNPQIFIDPTIDQEKESACSMTFAFGTKSFEMIASHTSGTFSVDQYLNCLSRCKEAAREISVFQRNSIERFLSKETNEDEEEMETGGDS